MGLFFALCLIGLPAVALWYDSLVATDGTTLAAKPRESGVPPA